MTMYPHGAKTPPKVSSPFGPRDPRVGISSQHNGADLIGFEDVHAVEAGTVTSAGWMNDAAGITVVINHGGGITSLYMHLERVSVSRGARVAEGAKIGEVGSTGNATGDCLHYEIRLNGRSIEPMGWTAARINAGAPAAAAPAYPLPWGSYFGPKSGPRESVSGFYSHREDLRRWQQRMRDRGWTINPDGLYGDQTGDVAEAFQREKGLTVDRKIGPATWAAAWTAPIT
ncbi:peptidase [Microbacterium phage PaoPu]|uniref:Endolysin n=1 Tax=Microbacterium phage PaoPu TaxID=2126933 RepID=A0A2R4A059_9CAUD|nr:peptidase [Microbacterium phage PaoPu]AXQ64365.1 endolysin [Microbacterium phage Minima]QPX62227.1 endolysin [Microbacterium phage JoBros]QXN73086.1 endolysin [Microbacterium phage ManAs]UDL14929.1 endolysin [Microbacterium phage Gardevoir]UQT02205.1 endolysin [Microbacterium phage Pondwater]URC17786.1 endolysin [Microbacterium phage Yubaba]URM86092.1 endolysin [Microbacterium phage Sara]UVF61321.1 endolysin [Microbacterium phage Witch]WNO27231.1 endolysin [Microbacterium phage Alucard]